MKRLPHVTVLLTTLLALATSLAPAYESLQGKTELLHWEKARAYEGYTLFASRGVSYLIDMAGRVVHTWPIGTNPRLLASGHLLDATRDDPSGFQGFRELDWDGNTVWEYQERRKGYAPHHDWVRIYNKKLKAWTTLYIANRSVTHAQAIAAGCDPRAARNYDGASVDAIVEVDMQGKVVWEWWFFDHVVQDVDASKPNYVGKGKTIADHPHRINLNIPGRPLRRDWLHCNSLDYNAETGHIVTNSVQGEFYVIDHDGTFVAGDPAASIAKAASAAGDFLYRFGDPARYGQGDPPAIERDWTRATPGHKQIGGSHDIHWIRPGLPGAGNFLIFNNGQYLFQRTNQSYVMEINPFLDSGKTATGRYVNPPSAGYRQVRSHHDTHKPTWQVSNQVVWMYSSKSNQGFFSHIGSGAQRLPNGNTLVCSMTEGHLFEVTTGGEVVWEYINPTTRDGAVTMLKDSLPMSNAVFRALRYGDNHPALKGKDLTPKGTITERWAQGLDRPTRIARGGQGDRRPGGPGRRDDRDGPRDRQPPPRDQGDLRGQARPDVPAAGGGRDGDRRGGQGRRPPGGGQRPPGGPQDRDRDRRPGRPVVLVKLDANADGRLSADEIAKAPAVLKALDANGDGKLSREELGRRIEETGRGDRQGDRREPPGGSDSRRGPPRDRDVPAPRTPRRDQPSGPDQGVTAPDATLTPIADGFQFTEGPAVDAAGDVYFSDVAASQIYKWSPEGKPAVFRSETGGANGLYVDGKGNLLACEGDRGRVVAIDSKGGLTVLADKYAGKRFNKPNDLWVDPKGGVYFSDPIYGRAEKTQDGEHVYYISPDRKQVLRVIDDMTRPNGLIGTQDGKTLYVTDYGAGKTWRYSVSADGRLTGKRLFADVGGDGMTIDAEGNVYLAERGVLVFDTEGKRIQTIAVPTRPTNVCFAGRDGQTLFITARRAVYSIRMRVRGASHSGTGGGKASSTRGPRRPPWPLVHAKELDANGDGAVTLDEMLAQATKTFTACDRNGDGKLTEDEYGSRDMPRTPMAGFVKGHARELDADRDGAISKTELLNVAKRMFHGSDGNHDGKLTADEYAEAVEFGKANPKQGPGQRPGPDGGQGRRRDRGEGDSRSRKP